MTLEELLSDLPSLEELRDLWLVTSPELAATLLERQSAHGDGINFASPVIGPDDRRAFSADLLTETGANGWAHATFSALNPAAFAAVEVISTASLIADGWFAADSEL